jgi:signal transduction histidine kinase
LKDSINVDVELSQLGLAVGIIHHEFNSTVKSIRGSIRDLKGWADVNDKLTGVYNNIRINFEHLDGYLNLFTPLNRRLYRKKEDILANDIKTFLLDLFQPRLQRHSIQLKHTTGFTRHTLHGYRSTFYPVFVNLIDNAIHWLNKKNSPGEKIIRLHADDTGFYISNNGPAIPPNDKEKIFDLGFTRKISGRGMGLHIARQVLEGANYKIFVDEPRPESTVTFKIESTNFIENE